MRISEKANQKAKLMTEDISEFFGSLDFSCAERSRSMVTFFGNEKSNMSGEKRFLVLFSRKKNNL